MSILDNIHPVDRTEAIELVKPIPTLFRSLNFFKARTVSSRSVQFDVRENQIRVLEDHLRNQDQTNSLEDSPFNIHTLPLAHYPVQRTITVEELSGVRGFNTDAEKQISTAVADKLGEMSEAFDLTEEMLQAQMVLTGQIATNHYGTYDMATEFGVARPTQELAVSGDIAVSLREAQRKSKDNLKGINQGYYAFVGSEMFEAILANAGVQEVLKYRQTSNPVLNELGQIGFYNTFQMGNILFVEYSDTFETKSGQVEVLATDSGVLVPRTTLGRVLYGPASTMSGVGSPGSRRFVRQHRDPKDRFVELEGEMNTLVINEQYAATVELSLPSAT